MRLLEICVLRAAYNPDEPRDDKGKWTAEQQEVHADLIKQGFEDKGFNQYGQRVYHSKTQIKLVNPDGRVDTLGGTKPKRGSNIAAPTIQPPAKALRTPQPAGRVDLDNPFKRGSTFYHGTNVKQEFTQFARGNTFLAFKKEHAEKYAKGRFGALHGDYYPGIPKGRRGRVFTVEARPGKVKNVSKEWGKSGTDVDDRLFDDAKRQGYRYVTFTSKTGAGTIPVMVSLYPTSDLTIRKTEYMN
jgi:hypothetical protein